MEKLSRPETTMRLYSGFAAYMRQKVYSTYDEIGVIPGGRRRADVVAFNMKREMIIGEVKSCWQDYSTDKKWAQYIPCCNKFYFVISTELWESHGEQIKMDVKPYGAGVIAINLEEYWADAPLSIRLRAVRVVCNARKHDMSPETKDWIITKLAWRGGMHKTRRSRGRRKRK